MSIKAQTQPRARSAARAALAAALLLSACDGALQPPGEETQAPAPLTPAEALESEAAAEIAAETGAEPADEGALAFDALPPAGPDDRRVAEVGGTPIYASDVLREAAAQEVVEDVSALNPGDPVFERVLEELIEQRLLALEARARGLHRSVEARHRLAAAEERILGNILVETAVSLAVSEAAIEQVYREQVRLTPPTEEVRARHILVSTPAEADQAIRLLQDGEDFAALARRISQDPATRFDGGDLGYFTREGILPAFAQAAFSTPEGEIAQPFQSEFGWHVLEVVDRRNQPRPGLEAMRPNIVRFLTLAGIQDLLEDIRAAYPVTRLSAPAPARLRADAQEEEVGAAPDAQAEPPGDGG